MKIYTKDDITIVVSSNAETCENTTEFSIIGDKPHKMTFTIPQGIGMNPDGLLLIYLECLSESAPVAVILDGLTVWYYKKECITPKVNIWIEENNFSYNFKEWDDNTLLLFKLRFL